jgi:carboxylate-amine ligase
MKNGFQSENGNFVETSKNLSYQPSPEVTLGVELELQIVDPDCESGELVPGALRILDACKEEGLHNVDGEFLLSMIEVKTDICRNVKEVKEALCPLLRQLRNIATALGYDLALGGTHPYSRACKNAISPGDRYERIRKRQGWMAYHEAIFGLHVHVGVPDAQRVQGLMNLLVPYLPHLLALSANSPFWEGVDTEFASARAALFRPSPHAGIPQYFSTWKEFCQYFEIMRQSGIYQDSKDLYWDLRPRPDFGTLEFRICDAPGSMEVLLGLTALIRCLVLHGLQRLEENPELGNPGPARTWLATENKFLASRYGLRAECMLDSAGPRETLEAQIRRLITDIRPFAEDAGEERYLQPFLNVETYETNSERLRRIYRQAGAWRPVLDEMRSRWVQELEEQPADLFLIA